MSEITKQRLLILAICLTTIPFFATVNLPSNWGLGTQDIQSVALYFSAVSGYIGVALLIWQLLLGTRSVSGLFFDDLPDKLKLHHKLGMYGSIAVLLHPVLLLVVYSESLVYVLWPTDDSSFELAVTYGRIAFWGMVLLWLSAVIFRKYISYRLWRYGHILASYSALAFVILHTPEIGSSFKNDWIQFYWYSFMAIAAICLILRLRFLTGLGKVKYTVVNKSDLNDKVYTITLKPVKKQLVIAAGQHVFIQAALLRESHPFSVLDYDPKTGQLQITIKVFGRFTSKLRNIKVGQKLLLDGPYGNFLSTQNNDKLTVYVAGGIGITPFYQNAISSNNKNTYLFFVNQDKQTVVFGDEFRSKLADNYIELFTQENIKGKNIEHGRFSSDILLRYINNPSNAQFYICGPKGMMDSATQQIKNCGVSEKNIHTEDFSF
ncbi:MAG: ferredoxin reductase family protein [Candidatus Woesebacteria bacterium]|jgi:predicted ferric reductase